jgi:G:T/U-mismatch repair DNA glycosylase
VVTTALQKYKTVGELVAAGCPEPYAKVLLSHLQEIADKNAEIASLQGKNSGLETIISKYQEIELSVLLERAKKANEEFSLPEGMTDKPHEEKMAFMQALVPVLEKSSGVTTKTDLTGEGTDSGDEAKKKVLMQNWNVSTEDELVKRITGLALEED